MRLTFLSIRTASSLICAAQQGAKKLRAKHSPHARRIEAQPVETASVEHPGFCASQRDVAPPIPQPIPATWGEPPPGGPEARCCRGHRRARSRALSTKGRAT